MADGKQCSKGLADKLCGEMGGFMPGTLKTINELDPEFMDVIAKMDEMTLSDGEIDKKTKRLIALACVTIRGCEGCVYAQAKVAKNFGATKKEILEVIKIAVLTGGVPCWSTARKGISQLFAEWEGV